jgi:formylglycine-generating enzyme required for sulfatase activity
MKEWAPLLALFVVAFASCAKDRADPPGRSAASSASAPAEPAATPSVLAKAPEAANAGEAATKSSPCPAEMALVDGKFCVDRWEASTENPDGSEHSPHHAFGPKKVKAVSRAGVIPQAFTSAEEGAQACERAGKHLCTTQEWQDACMGSTRPYRIYPYGMSEEKGNCNTNRRLRPLMRVFGEDRRDSVSMNDARLNQEPDTVARTGEFDRCVTPQGVFDMQGNLLEWTQGDQKALLMGGHYIDAVQHGKGCRYVTAGHGAQYHDYTTGFRCCKKPDRDAVVEASVATETPVSSAITAETETRDPPGMRGFTDPVGKLPRLTRPAYESADAKCPNDMVVVEGLRCAEPIQFCKSWLPRLSHGEKIACAEFSETVECRRGRRKMSYCIDRYEFTPPGYTYPLTHVNYGEAQNLCHEMGKRLCEEEEWEFACEGPEALPYPYGFVRDGTRCNHDFPEVELVKGPDQMTDRRVKADALPECKSPFGVMNLVGNVDEWTMRPTGGPGHHAILRGGWWLVGRNRCRAATANHGERYAGVQTGFRCCQATR